MRMGYTDVDETTAGVDKKTAAMQKITGQFEKVRGIFGHRRVILVVVFIALFLDNMLLTVVVPIIPDFLLDQRVKNTTSIMQELTVGMNSSCAEYIRPPVTPIVGSRLPIYASRGHSPHQHLTVLLEQMFSSKATKATELDSVDHFIDYLASQNVNYSEHSAAYRDFVRSCEEDARSHVRNFRSKTVGHEHIMIGVMFASKSVVQLIVNPFIGPLTNRIGYSIPMFSGFVIMFLSTIIFAFGDSYAILFSARAVQGLGSACSSVSGMGMLASVYTDDKERGKAFGWALSGLALGVLVGPPFGGICYQFINKEAPFLILAALALGDGLLQLTALRPKVCPETVKGTSLWTLLKDPYILIAAGSITFGNMGIAMLEPSLPLWMWEKMRAQGWQQGMAFLPCSISYLIGTNVFGPLATRIGRGLSAGIGMVLCGVCLIAIPFSTIMEHLIAPMFGLGFAIGMVDSSMMPIMGQLVDLRHVAVYGSVYAIADVAFCLGFAIGPIISGSMVQSVGFSWMLWTISIVCLLYAPLTLLLRNPPARDEAKALVNRNTDAIINTATTTGQQNTKEMQTVDPAATHSVQRPTNYPQGLGKVLGYDPTNGGQQTYGYQ